MPMLAFAVGFALFLVLLVVARRRRPGQRGRRTAVTGEPGATFTYLGSDAGHCDSGADGGGCDGGGGDD